MSSYKFAKNFGIIGFANFFIALEKIILLPVITKLLGAENYGIWAQVGVTISLFTPLLLLGLPYTLVRFLAAEKEKEKIQEGFYSVFFLIFLLVIFGGLILVLFSGVISNFLQIPQSFINILALIVVFECLDLVLLAFFQAFQEIGKYALFQILQAFGEVGLVVLAIFLGYGVYGAVLSLLIIRVAVFLLLFSLILRRIGLKIPQFSRIKDYLSFGLPTLLSSISYWTVTSSDRYLIGYLVGILFVGYYSSAHALGNILTFFIYPFSFLLPPVLSQLFDEGKIEQVKIYLKYSLKYFLLIGLPAIFGLSILSKELITIFSTKEIADNSYFITPFVTLSMLLYGLYTVFVQILVLSKKTKTFGSIWLASALLNIIFNLIFIPHLGILAAAIGCLISYSFGLGMTWHFAFKNFQFKIDWQSLVKIILSSILMGLFVLWLNPAGIAKTIIAIISGALIYGVSLFLLRGFSQEEKEFIKRIFKLT